MICPNFNGMDSFTYKVSDGSLESNTATVTITVTAVNDPPTITAAAALSRQQGAAGTVSTIATVADVEGAAGSLSVSVASAPTGISVTGITNTNGTITATVAAACNATLGANTVGLKVTDGGGAMATANLTVNVTASNAPVITPKPALALFPPNHMYTTVTLSQMVQSATDDCDGNLLGSVVIEKVTSDEVDNAPGGSDGNTVNDIVIAADCKSVQLRAERDETKNGRVYTITLRVRDTSGNTARAVFKVNVPLNQSGAPAVDSGVAQTVMSSCP
ncbi:MAG: Ig-like domain-containing protein [Blastocatellia bacterium]